jgi:hypothetical protein
MKQLTIAFAYSVFFAACFAWVYAFFWKVIPTCLDGIKNQNETALDCGGVCGACAENIPVVDLQVTETALVYADPEHSDVVVKIHNPNDRYGASKINYTITLKDGDGKTVSEEKGASFILPKESKYLLLLGRENKHVFDIAVTFDAVEWQTLTGYKEKPVLTVRSKRYGPVATGVGYGQVIGTLFNESGFDIQSIRVKIILRDASGRAIAVNQTEMNRLPAGDQRDVGPLVFPAYFPGDVSAIEMEPEVDVYHLDEFVRKFSPKLFQRL